jgi:hypothetical protein
MAALAVTTWVSGAFLLTRLLPSPEARWPVAFTVGAAVAAFVGLWGQWWAPEGGKARSPKTIADKLAARLRRQWTREAENAG